MSWLKKVLTSALVRQMVAAIFLVVADHLRDRVRHGKQSHGTDPHEADFRSTSGWF
jgi:hypothetical protein